MLRVGNWTVPFEEIAKESMDICEIVTESFGLYGSWYFQRNIIKTAFISLCLFLHVSNSVLPFSPLRWQQVYRTELIWPDCAGGRRSSWLPPGPWIMHGQLYQVRVDVVTFPYILMAPLQYLWLIIPWAPLSIVSLKLLDLPIDPTPTTMASVQWEISDSRPLDGDSLTITQTSLESTHHGPLLFLLLPLPHMNIHRCFLHFRNKSLYM